MIESWWFLKGESLGAKKNRRDFHPAVFRDFEASGQTRLSLRTPPGAEVEPKVAKEEEMATHGGVTLWREGRFSRRFDRNG
jgi:hypothetical protein